ncbi:MAG: 16S rRNA (guanine(527)-N(7))-methyltransferase RsmG [Candidatus Azobacteroides pseudotrichonymphae]|nr:MAG: 16S rRNA (guanine(527)-N(7))-methyltransferase RsmG [Candidatus Azobacteroides pseudotrichonymphae]
MSIDKKVKNNLPQQFINVSRLVHFENSLVKYFPYIVHEQKVQFFALRDLYTNWNRKANLISRKDIGNLYERHVLHSLGIAQIISFCDYSTILDVGTGGGFPGVPLAILFPNVRFLLLDSTAKKIKILENIISKLNLRNVKCKCMRAEYERGQFDFIISRAAMPLLELVNITQKNISIKQQNTLPNGFLCLKGGNLHDELEPFKKRVIEYKLSNYFQEEFFKKKKVIYLPV